MATLTDPNRRLPPRKRPSEGLTKKFACEVEGCTRRFTRAEHLQRHLLNHTPGDHTCERCSAHFKRKDLLERHLARHRQKDEEAGVEGQGVLNTRKRLWKNEDGDIVTKRPALENPDQDRTLPFAENDIHAEAPISPPVSTHQSDASGQGLHHHQQETLTFPDTAPVSSGQDLVYGANFLTSTENENFWPTNADYFNHGPVQSAPFDEYFNPDTASSFNMPVTTMNNYVWLFDPGLAAADMTITTDISTLMQPAVSGRHDSSMSTAAVHGTDRQCPINDPFRHDFIQMQTQQSIQSSVSTDCTFYDGSIPRTAAPSSIYTAGPATGMTSPSIANTPSHEEERPLSLLGRSNRLPIIDEVARSLVLDLISATRPCLAGEPITRDHPLLSLKHLQTYCDLFFTHFNATYPLLHQPTFDASDVDPLLLTAVLLLGATYSEKDAHQLAVCIHDVLRPQIFSSEAFNARPDLWVLQTILLVECFGKSRAGRRQHDMAHLFHGMLINLIRRSDCQSVKQPSLGDSTEDLEVSWRDWAEAEQKRRVAFLCFMWDTQHAVLFSQSLCMSAFELRTMLPCDQALWEAPCAKQWYQMEASRKTAPSFLTCLKSYLTPSTAVNTRPLNALSRVILLHGLMSISWDMRRRDQTSLGVADDEGISSNWKLRLGAAYDVWKSDFDAYCHAYRSRCLSSNGEAVAEFACFVTAQNAIYHSAHMILNAELLDLQIYAGARHILGRPVTKQDYNRSQAIVKDWLVRDHAAASRAAWHAAHILQDASVNLDKYDCKGLFHLPWCLYIATLTVWAFHHGRNGTFLGIGVSSPSVEGHARVHDDDEMIYDAPGEMQDLLTSMIASLNKDDLVAATGQRGTRGLIAVVARMLGRVRWAIVHDGMVVLKGLVPWRLISQGESSLRGTGEGDFFQGG